MSVASTGHRGAVLPSLSVVLPNFNHARHLPAALEAILSQSVRPLQLIVVDDGSTDESVHVIESVARGNSLVQVVRNDRNLGAVVALNEGLARCKGDFVYLAAADDRVLPGLFERSLQLLAEHPGAGACFADFMLLDSRTGRLTPGSAGLARHSTHLAPAALVHRLRRIGDSFAGCSTILRRDALVEAGGLLEELEWKCDWFAALTIAFRYGACYVREPLAAYRFDPAGYSQRGAWDRRSHGEILNRVLTLLASSPYADVASGFYRSGVLSRFGLRAVHAAFARRGAETERLWVPVRRALLRELKDLLTRVGPYQLRPLYWALRAATQPRPR